MITVYASIGNSDDKLSQQKWSRFARRFMVEVEFFAAQVHGQWYSAPDAPFQNACACFEIDEEVAKDLKRKLEILRGGFDQDSIAWAVVERTEFLGASS